MVYQRLFITLAILSLASSIAAQDRFGAVPARSRWLQINTDTARIIFQASQQEQALRIASVIHRIHRTTNTTIGDGLKKVNMVLQPQTTIPNAYVRMAPFRSELFMTPGADNFASGSVQWADNLSIHEYRHVQQFTNFNKGLTRVFSTLLGQEGQLLANGMTVPDYFFEGDAVFQETLVSHQGRGRMPYFFNEHKAIWQANKKFSWMRWRNGSLRSLSPDHYPTGYLLTAYGYEKYGADFWKKVTEDAVRFKGLFYPFIRAIEKHSGKSYTTFREDAFQHFRAQSFPGNQAFYKDLNYLTPVQQGNVINYYHPQFDEKGDIIVLQQSNRDIPTFYRLQNGQPQKIRVKDIGIDNYFSYRKGKIVYAAYNIDSRWGWKEYSEIRLLDAATGVQKNLTSKTKYFSPDISPDASQVLVVHTNADGSSTLRLISSNDGQVLRELPNPNRYFFTQSKFTDNDKAVSAVRHPDGRMALVLVNLTTGETENLMPFTPQAIGYPFEKNGIVYFSMTHEYADKIFSLRLSDKQFNLLTQNDNSIYQPSVNDAGDMLCTVVQFEGRRIARLPSASLKPIAVDTKIITRDNDIYTPRALQQPGVALLDSITPINYTIKKYRKSFQLLNFHSSRPVIAAPEYGYSVYSTNMLNTFTSTLTYTYNENERSHKGEWLNTWGGWLPVFYLGVDGTFNRNFILSNNRNVNFNSATLKAGVYIPLRFVSGRTSQTVVFGGGFNAEQLYYTGIGKNIFDNRSFNYYNLLLNFTSFGQQAKQHIFPRWGQSLSVTYRDAVTFTNSHKLVAVGNLFFPGLFKNHNIVLTGAYQKRDTLGDLFSNTFPFSRGYEALRTRRMYRWSANYHFPLLYPDWGIGNIAFVQRIRGNLFYDYTSARARLNGVLQEIPARTAGVELYLDGKIWNALPISIGVRYNRLLDRDLLDPGAKNVWQIVLPIGLIPN
jgi:hypothetical protein